MAETVTESEAVTVTVAEAVAGAGTVGIVYVMQVLCCFVGANCVSPPLSVAEGIVHVIPIQALFPHHHTHKALYGPASAGPMILSP